MRRLDSAFANALVRYDPGATRRLFELLQPTGTAEGLLGFEDLRALQALVPEILAQCA